MQGFAPLGRALIALAILSLVGELTARAFFGATGIYLSAEELWAALAPDSYTAMRAWFRQGILPFWTYGVGPVLKAPAWLLFGAPGIAALWRGERRDDEAEIAADVEAAFLYDELEKRAKEEGFAGGAERSPAAVADDILASAREAQADLARDSIPSSPPQADPNVDDAGSTPLSRPPS